MYLLHLLSLSELSLQASRFCAQHIYYFRLDELTVKFIAQTNTSVKLKEMDKRLRKYPFYVIRTFKHNFSVFAAKYNLPMAIKFLPFETNKACFKMHVAS